jgi:hypothetical protein
VLHCVLLLRLPTVNVKIVFCDSALVCSVWLHGASRDACPVCDKPFYGKQKFVRCSGCDISILQLGEAEQASISATGESAYKCDSCAKSLGSSDNDKLQTKLTQNYVQ